jgi:3-deoxy-D-manno-octulosonic-acid transferase
MRLLYSFGIKIYSILVLLLSLFNQKARLMISGRKLHIENFENDNKPIWIHAASLGEFEQGRPLIERIRNDYPNKKIVLTFFSPSGFEEKKDYKMVDLVTYIPFDTKRNSKEFISKINPSVVVFIKYEFWFNFLFELNKRKIPTVFISAIFRKDQVYFKKPGKWFLKHFKTVKYFFVQNDESTAILKKNNINQVAVAGDTRFDAVISNKETKFENKIIAEFLKSASCIVFGSTWDLDHNLIIELIKSGKLDGKKIIIAPHEIKNSEIDKIIVSLNGKAGRYSKGETNYDVLLIDKIGLLKYIYRFGDFAYIGGGFGVGIHNTLEAVAYEIPVVFGPNFKKFDEAVLMMKLGIGFSVSDYPEFETKILQLNGTDLKKALAPIIQNFIVQNKGATDLIISYLKAEKLL